MRYCSLLFLTLFTAASAAASDAYHLVLKRQGRAQLSVNVAMCDGTEVRRAPELEGGELTFEVSPGGSVTPAKIPYFRVGQKVNYANDQPYWPDEITVTARVEKRPAEASGELTLTPKVPPLVGFLI